MGQPAPLFFSAEGYSAVLFKDGEATRAQRELVKERRTGGELAAFQPELIVERPAPSG